MLYTIAQCDICHESKLKLEFENDTETLLDLLAATRDMQWTVNVLPGPVYHLRCQNCQSKTQDEYMAEQVRITDDKKKL